MQSTFVILSITPAQKRGAEEGGEGAAVGELAEEEGPFAAAAAEEEGPFERG